MTGLSHRGLSGDNMRECGAVFLYVLTTMAARTNIQRLFGVSQVATPSMFGDNPFKTD